MTKRKLPAPFDDFLKQLRQAKGADAAELAERYVSAHFGRFPVVEGSTAHFLALEHPDRITGLSGDWNGYDARRSLMQPIGGGLLHYQHDFEPDARIDYLLTQIDAEFRDKLHDPELLRKVAPISFRDPFNVSEGESGVGNRSELTMPQYSRPAISFPRAGTPAGALEAGMINSEELKMQREYAVYLPPGYSTSAAPYPTIYFHDGRDYLTMGRTPIILDNLIADGAIPPVAAVFVPPVLRFKEYNCNPTFNRFFDDELIPDLHRRYNLSDDPRQCAVMGPSMGGIVSLYMGSKLSHRFRMVGAQSAVVQGFGAAKRFDSRRAYRKPPEGFKLHLVIGSYEGCFGTDPEGNCRDLLTPVRELRDVVAERGYTYRYLEPHQGHSWGMWRDTTADALTFFYG